MAGIGPSFTPSQSRRSAYGSSSFSSSRMTSSRAKRSPRYSSKSLDRASPESQFVEVVGRFISRHRNPAILAAFQQNQAQRQLLASDSSTTRLTREPGSLDRLGLFCPRGAMSTRQASLSHDGMRNRIRTLRALVGAIHELEEIQRPRFRSSSSRFLRST